MWSMRARLLWFDGPNRSAMHGIDQTNTNERNCEWNHFNFNAMLTSNVCVIVSEILRF